MAVGAPTPASSANLPAVVRRWTGRLLAARSMRVLAVRALGMGALFGLEVALARALGASGYGVFAFALAIAAIIARLAPLGWTNASMRFVSSFLSRGDLALLKGSLILGHFATLAGLVTAALLLVLLADVLGLADGRQTIGQVLLLASVLAFMELHRNVLRALSAADYGEAIPLLLLPGLVTLLVLGLGIGEPEVAIYVYGGVGFGLVLCSSGLIWQALPAALTTVSAVFRSREWSLIALPMLIGSASSELLARAAVIVLGSLGTDHDVGLYQAAARLSLMNLFVLRALTPIVGPRLSVLHTQGDRRELRAAYGRAALFSVLGCMPFWLMFMIFPGWVLSWFGPEFVESAPILRLLSVGYLIAAAAGPAATGLMMIGKQKVYGALAVGSLLANVLGCVVMVHYAGALGAAIATASVLGGINILNAVVFLRATR